MIEEYRDGLLLPLPMPLFKQNQYSIATIVFFLFLIFGFNLYSEETNESTILFQNESDLLLVGKQTYFLEDKDGKLSITDILKPEIRNQFQLNQKSIFTHKPTNSAFWIKLNIENQSGKDAWLELGSTFLWTIDYYAERNGKYELVTETGSLLPETNKSYPTNLFWLPLGSLNQKRTIYARIYTQRPIAVPIQIGSILSLSSNRTKQDFLISGFVGLMSVMFLYNLFLFFVTRDKLYLFYIGYVFFAIPTILYTHNYPFFNSIFNENVSRFLNSHPFVWVNIPFIFICFFAIRFLNLSEKPYVRKIQLGLSFYTIMAIAALDFLSLLPHSNLVRPSQTLSLVGLVYSFSISSYIWRIEKKTNARFFCFAWFWVILGLILYVFTMNGVIEYNFWSRNAVVFGLGMEALMFSLALGDRINTMRDENFLLVKNQNQVLERKVSERTQELENLNATKDKFFSIIAHDLRNPFAGIMGLSEIMESELLEDKKETESDFLKYTQMIFASSQAGLSLINNLTQWAKSQIGEIIISPQNISLKFLLFNTIPIIKGNAFNKNIVIEQDLTDQDIVFADEALCSTILRNLLTNAIKFTHPGGKIIVSTIRKEKFLEISVSDTGVGIDPKNLEKIFRIDSKFSSLGTEKENGTGLGLILCKEFVEKQGGAICLHSETGKGTTFTFTLPLGT